MDLNVLKLLIKNGEIPVKYEFVHDIQDEKISIYKDKNQEKVAVKKYIKEYVLKNGDKCYNEIKILKQAESKWVIELIDSFMTRDDSVILIMPFYSHGDLFNVMLENEAKETSFSDVQIRNVFIQMLNALKYLHSLNIIHRDIKMENIIVTNSSYLFNIILIDFECAIIYNPKYPPCDNVGTLSYKAPEVEKRKAQDFKVDIWSLGVVIYSMKTKDQFDRKYALKHSLIKSDRNLLNLLSGIFQKNPKKRFTIVDCIDHKWVNIMKIFKKMSKL